MDGWVDGCFFIDMSMHLYGRGRGRSWGFLELGIEN